MRDPKPVTGSSTILRASWQKRMAKKIEFLIWEVALPIRILAVHDFGLLRMEFRLAIRKPLLQHV